MRFHPFSLSSSSFRDACSRDLENEGSFSWFSLFECVRACVRAILRFTRTHTNAARLSRPRPTANLAIEFIFLAPVDTLFSQPGVDTSPPSPFLLFTPVIICRSVGEPDYRVLVIWSIEKRNGQLVLARANYSSRRPFRSIWISVVVIVGRWPARISRREWNSDERN